MSTYTLNIHVVGKDDASQPLQRVAGSLGRIGEFALGGMLAQGILSIGSAVSSIARDALGAVANYERLGMSLESLLARELREASGKTMMVQAGFAHSEMTKEEVKQLGKLQKEMDAEIERRDKLAPRLQLEAERHAQLIKRYGENSFQVREHSLRLNEMRAEYNKIAGAIDTHHDQIIDLKNTNTGLVPVLKRVTVGQLSMAEALDKSKGPAKELLSWIQKLAIESPFKQEDVANAFRLQLAYGFTTKEAKRLTQAMIDFAAGSGASADSMRMIGLALGQIKARGKLAGQEILQLVNAGIPVRQILAKAFGVTTEQLEKMVEKGLVPADKAIEAITKTLEEDFGGAAKRQATTFSGLISSLEDIKDVGLREFFTGTFEAIKPHLIEFVDLLSSPETMKKIREFGQDVGGAVRTMIDAFKTLMPAIQSVLDELFPKRQKRIRAFGNVEDEVKKSPGLLDQLVDKIVDKLKEAGPKIQKQLTKWKDDFWDWLTGSNGVLKQVGGKMGKLTEEMKAWSEDPKTRREMQEIGKSLASQVLEGVKSMFGSPETGNKTLLGFLATLKDSVFRVQDTVTQVGADIATGIVNKILAAFVGQETADKMTAGLAGIFKQIFASLLNPLYGITMAVTNFVDALGKLVAATIAFADPKNLTDALAWLVSTAFGALSGMTAFVWNMLNAAGKILGTLIDGFKTNLAAMTAAFGYIIGQAINAILDILGLSHLLNPLYGQFGVNGSSGFGLPSRLAPAMAGPSSSSTVNNFTLIINSQARTEQVAGDFMLMKALAGS